MKYSDAVINFDGTGLMINEAQRRMDTNIEKAFTLLKLYGVKKADLEKIAGYRLGLFKDLPI